jgi:hypothetical protein
MFVADAYQWHVITSESIVDGVSRCFHVLCYMRTVTKMQVGPKIQGINFQATQKTTKIPTCVQQANITRTKQANTTEQIKTPSHLITHSFVTL